MNLLIIHLVGPDTQVRIQISQRPNRLLSWSNGFRHLSNLLHDLGIAKEVVHKLGIGCPKQALNHRAIAGFGPRTSLLLAPVVGDQRLKVGATKIWPTIDDDGLWQTPIAADTLAQGHHTRTVTRW